MSRLTKYFLVPLFLLSSHAHALNDVYVIHFVLDGTRRDVLETMMKKGELPHLKEHLTDPGAVFDKAITVFPTVSTPAYVSFATGLEPQNSNVFFLEWFDRTKHKVVSYLSLRGLRRANTDLLNRLSLRDPTQMELYPKVTLFEKLFPEPAASIYAPFTRGATYALPKTIPLSFVWSTTITRNGHAMNRIAMKKLLGLFSKQPQKIPRYSLVALYGPDHYGHSDGPDSEETHEDIKKFDNLFETFFQKLKSRGLQDKTYFIISSDHGMHETEKVFRLRKFFKKIGAKRRTGMYVGNRGVSSTFLYIKGKEGWEKLPTLDWLRHFPIKKEAVDLIQTLLEEEEVGWLAVRDGLDRVRIFSDGGEGVISQLRVKDKTFYSYSYKTKDPLNYSANPKLNSMIGRKMFSQEEWLQATIDEERPNAVVALSNLFENPKVGDILVVAKEPWGFRKAKAGTHGSLNQDDLRMPLWIAGPNIPHRHFGMARGVDLYPTILSWFGLENGSTKNQEGRLLFSRKADRRSGTQDFLKQCKEEIQLSQERIQKYKNLRGLLESSPKQLKVPRKLRKNMKWLLAIEEEQETERLKKMERYVKTFLRP